jgi:hypothetical protein
VTGKVFLSAGIGGVSTVFAEHEKSSIPLLESGSATHVTMGAPTHRSQEEITMGHIKHAGRIGALALALGIGAAGIAGTAAISLSTDSSTTTTTINALQKEKEPKAPKPPKPGHKA